MNRRDYQGLLASIAASYTRRELDRSAYDRIMESTAGRSLTELPQGTKYALEFIMYAVSAYALRGSQDASAIRRFLSEVIADAPSEIAKRMINGKTNVSSEDLETLVSRLSDTELEEIAQISETHHTSELIHASTPPQPTSSIEKSALRDLADRINESTERRRQNRLKRRGK